jgi:hypothetical protein
MGPGLRLQVRTLGAHNQSRIPSRSRPLNNNNLPVPQRREHLEHSRNQRCEVVNSIRFGVHDQYCDGEAPYSLLKHKAAVDRKQAVKLTLSDCKEPPVRQSGPARLRDGDDLVPPPSRAPSRRGSDSSSSSLTTDSLPRQFKHGDRLLTGH